MLKLENITAGYGKKQVLTDVSFYVEIGDIVLLSGNNGSGKSTILKTIYGLLKPWNKDGKIIYDDENITDWHPSEMIRRGIVYMPQKKNVFDDFTVEENLLTSAATYPKQEALERIEEVFATIPILKTMRKRTPFYLSGGEKQLLAFGNVLLHLPKLMLLDEPFACVDVRNSEILNNCIQDLHKKNVTFVIVEHKRQLMDDMVTREIELELGMIKIFENTL